MLPGQGLIQTMGPQIIVRIQAAVRGRLLPERQIELLPPTVQPRAALPSAFSINRPIFTGRFFCPNGAE